MATVSTSQFKSGLKLMIDGNPCSIIENEIVKPGKGQAFNRVKLMDLVNQRMLEKISLVSLCIHDFPIQEHTQPS